MKPMNSKIQSGWEFPSFRLDKANATLWRGDKVVPLRPKSFSALCYLIERHGQLVTKDELLDAVWQNRCVGEAVLKVCINELRQALDDKAHDPIYLTTIARRGYRFSAPVTAIRAEVPTEETGVPVRQVGPSPVKYRFWVGRESVQAKLFATWQKAVGCVRQVVFVTGEPGIGKTTLIEMFLRQVGEYSPMVLRMRCVKHLGEGEALMPMIEAMEKRCRGPEGAKLIELLHRHAPVWLAQLPSVLKPDEREMLQREIFGASRERMVREGCELLEALSKERPLILVLEDLHWSDHATMDFLSLLARRHESAPLMVVASYRPVDANLRAHPVTSIHRELQMRDVCSEIELAPFSLDEVRTYLARRFPDAVIPDSVSQALFARTGGLPLFVSSLTEYLVSQNKDWPMSPQSVMDKALPETIRRVIEREIERLSLEEQRLLGVASAIGSQFSPLLLGTVLDMNVAEVDRCCDALARRGQILGMDGMEQNSQGEVACTYVFRHALYVEVLYQRLSASQLIRLHLRIGECLERLHGQNDLKHAAELALHFEKGWGWERAVFYLTQAADNAARRFANREAYDYLARALAMVGRLPEENQAEARIALLRQTSAIRRSMGEMSDAKADLELMLVTARAAGNHRAEVLALLELSRILVWLDRRKCLEMAEQALARSSHLEDKILQSIVKGMWGGLNLMLGSWRVDCAKACYDAMDQARVSGNPLVLHSRLTQHIYVEVLASNYRRASVTADKALELSRSLGDGYMFMVGHYYQGLALLHLGEWGKLRRISEESRHAFESNCDDVTLPFRLHGQILMAWLHVEACDFATAKIYCEEVLQENRGPWERFISAHFSAIYGRALLGVRDYEGAIRCFDSFFKAEEDESLPVSRNYCFPAYLGASETYLSLGDFEKAGYYAKRLLDLAQGAPEKTYLALGYRLLAEIAIGQGALDHASVQIASALTITENSEVPLAAWRVYSTAEQLHHLEGETIKAGAFLNKRQEAIRKLRDSLPESDSLQECLHSPMGFGVPTVIDGGADATADQLSFNMRLFDAA
jgi:DNA-binding winged helix-turn-helix (wHTH) protein/tetratricopeptide (TPR) repeat protein